jgi:hypothetical protein
MKHEPFGDAGWTAAERKIIGKLHSPYAIQQFLDGIEYSADPFYRAPRRVLRDRLAHCMDGAVFAAAALRGLGFPPLVVDLRAEHDDDHLLAPFRLDGCWGAVAKSNFVTLRWREPVYRSLRELVMSYFEGFYNVVREKTLRSYSTPLNLAAFDSLRWLTDDEALETIAARLDSARHFPVASKKAIARLQLLDERSHQAGLIGSKPEGLYRP